MRLPWLPDVLRAAGLEVDVYPGWETRGSEVWGMDNPGFPSPLRGVICHATASNINSTDADDMRVLWVTGSVTAPVPISQCFLSRSGRWVVGATGRCNHVLRGDKGPHEGFGNYQLIGVEAQNNNLGEPWSAHMLDSYERGVAAICKHMGWAAGVAVAHREHQTGKSDPLGIDMAQFRAAVAAIMAGTQPPTEDDMSPEESALLNDAAWRQDAAWSGSPVIRGGTYKGTPYELNVTLKRIEAKLDALASDAGIPGGEVTVSDESVAEIAEAVADEQHERLAE
jgi:hypothetical protein